MRPSPPSPPCPRSRPDPVVAPPAAASGGLLAGFVGVLIFSLSLPMTRLAVADLDPFFVTFGRGLLAGLLAAVLLRRRGARRPDAADTRGLLVVAAGVVLGFPLFSTLAMRSVPAAHGAVVNGILPLGTALCAAWLARERPTIGFWACAAAGSALVVAFALRDGAGGTQGMGGLQPGDGWMLLAVVAGAVGYAEGGRLSRRLGGIDVICWALVLSLPLMAPTTAWLLLRDGWPTASAPAWTGFAYVSLMSQLVGFFFWYAALAKGGVARVGQVQLLQPFLGVLGAAAFVGEPLEPVTLAFAVAVIAVVALGRRMPVRAAATAAGPPSPPRPPSGVSASGPASSGSPVCAHPSSLPRPSVHDESRT